VSDPTHDRGVMRPPRRTELATTARLAMPLVLAQVGLMAMGVVDTVMVGRVSAAALAAVVLGNLFFYTLSTGAACRLRVSRKTQRPAEGRVAA